MKHFFFDDQELLVELTLLRTERSTLSEMISVLQAEAITTKAAYSTEISILKSANELLQRQLAEAKNRPMTREEVARTMRMPVEVADQVDWDAMGVQVQQK